MMHVTEKAVEAAARARVDKYDEDGNWDHLDLISRELEKDRARTMLEAATRHLSEKLGETAMSTTIPGVPEKISRADYEALIASTGIEPRRIKSLKFLPTGIHAVVFAIDKAGNKIADPVAGVATHTIYIPVACAGTTE